MTETRAKKRRRAEYQRKLDPVHALAHALGVPVPSSAQEYADLLQAAEDETVRVMEASDKVADFADYLRGLK